MLGLSVIKQMNQHKGVLLAVFLERNHLEQKVGLQRIADQQHLSLFQPGGTMGRIGTRQRKLQPIGVLGTGQHLFGGFIGPQNGKLRVGKQKGVGRIFNLLLQLLAHAVFLHEKKNKLSMYKV